MIEKAFENARGKSVLFLGRLKNFTAEEVKIFLKQYRADFTEKLDENVAVVIESTMLNPPQEEVSYEVYKQKIPTFRLDEFEKLYAQKITPDSLLMSLKLSNDQSRIIRLLKNESFEDALYLKLFTLYDWKGLEVHESDENRDVTTSFVKRFYNPEQFMDPAMIYSPVTLMTIVAESEDAQMLEAMLSLPHYEIKISKGERRPRTLKEMIALNPHANEETLKQLSRFNNLDIDYFLVQNDTLPSSLQEKIYQRANRDIKLMLTQNANLSETLFDALLQEDDDEVVQYLLVYQKMTKARYEKAKDNKFIEVIGENEAIEDILEELLLCDNLALQRRLASNKTVQSDALEKIYARYHDVVVLDLSTNPNLSPIMIEAFSKRNEKEIDIALAANPSTPTDILIAYFNLSDDALNLALASNEALPIAYLQQLQLDSSLMSILANNKTFTKNLLNGLGI